MTGSEVVGGVHPLHGASPFARAPVVLLRPDVAGQFVQVRRYRGHEEAEGELLTQADWTEMVESGLAFLLPRSLPAARGGALWVFRAAYGPARSDAIDAVRKQDVLLAEPIAFDDEAVVCHVREPEASSLRDRWRGAAYDRAWTAVRAGRIEDARRDAELAFVLDLRKAVDPPALLACIYEMHGGKAEAEQLGETMRLSRGEAFYQTMRAKWRNLVEETEAHRRLAEAERQRPRGCRELAEQRLAHIRDAQGALSAKEAA
ncbi:MAG: hypothetical protein QME96_04875 [Myxococcota bacterium]|nr:hypothetical protein [Myxococcota bacterium]